ncbi:Membrane-bound metallopeptidase [butyrate-producing bacterium SM4/1]|nr:Membrane-bound metallopeptidase [butyrate-producing bacterium SM4/1]
MGKRSIKTGLIALAAVLAVIPVQAAGKGDIDSAKDKISSLEEEKKKTEETIQELEKLKADTESYVKELDGELARLDDELSSLDSRITDKEADIEETKAQLEEAKKTEEEQYASMKLRIKYMYEKGDTSYLDLLLESGSMSEMLNRAEYIQQISSYDRKKLTEYGEIKEKIADDEEKLEAEHEELLTLQEQTKAKQDSVEKLVGEKSRELQKYQNQIAANESQLASYQADIEAQENRIQQIEAELKRQEEEARKKAQEKGEEYKTVSIGNISFIWPCPSSSRITSGFGGRSSPTEGASSNHKGIDIGASSGSDIVAAADGTVTISTYSYSAGNYIMINHGGGVSTVYMHCSKLLVSVGETVKKGQVIAKVGSTGCSTGPHLHFGVRVNGAYVNPSQYVSP